MRDLIKYKRIDEIVIAIYSHSTLKEAATSLDCDVRTLQRYMDNEEFRERFYEFSSLTQKAAAITLAAHLQKAVQTITELLDSPKDPIRLQAANSLLKHHDRMVSAVQVLDQIQLLKSIDRKAEAKERN